MNYLKYFKAKPETVLELLGEGPLQWLLPQLPDKYPYDLGSGKPLTHASIMIQRMERFCAVSKVREVEHTREWIQWLYEHLNENVHLLDALVFSLLDTDRIKPFLRFQFNPWKKASRQFLKALFEVKPTLILSDDSWIWLLVFIYGRYHKQCFTDIENALNQLPEMPDQEDYHMFLAKLFCPGEPPKLLLHNLPNINKHDVDGMFHFFNHGDFNDFVFEYIDVPMGFRPRWSSIKIDHTLWIEENVLERVLLLAKLSHSKEQIYTTRYITEYCALFRNDLMAFDLNIGFWSEVCAWTCSKQFGIEHLVIEIQLVFDYLEQNQDRRLFEGRSFHQVLELVKNEN